MARFGYAVLVLCGVLIQMICLNGSVASWSVRTGLYQCPEQPNIENPGFMDKIREGSFDEKDAISGAEEFVGWTKDTAGNIYDKIGDLMNPEELSIPDQIYNLLPEVESECLYQASYFLLYRVSFAYVVFFGFFSLLMIKVESSDDIRSGIQNGYWGIKLVLMIALSVGFLFIKEGVFDDFMYVLGCVGGTVFILYQLVYLLDWAYSTTERLQVGMSEEDGCSKFMMYFGSFGGYLAVLTSVILMFVFFGGSGCGLNNFFISMALILSVVMLGMSIHPRVQEENESSGILQAAVISLYVCYLTFSAMSTEHDPEYDQCNPMSNSTGAAIPGSSSGFSLMNGSSMMGTVLFVLVVLYSTIFGGGSMSESSSQEIPLTNDAETGKVHDDEAEKVKYNYSLFHLGMGCASLYITMNFTNWLTPGNELSYLWPAVWIRIVTSWVACAMYIWSLIAPIVLSDRLF